MEFIKCLTNLRPVRPKWSTFFFLSDQRRQQGRRGRPAMWRYYLGDQWRKHGKHAEYRGPEQDQKLHDTPAAVSGEVISS